MKNWKHIKDKYLIFYKAYQAIGYSPAAADELAILEARRAKFVIRYSSTHNSTNEKR